MVRFVSSLAALTLVAGCTTTGPAAPPEVPKPVVVGKVPTQPGNCYFKDPAGKVFISACPPA
ncbi:MAG: hypothetical protein IPL47_03615 [Phyllobacteriaceae bacterium]|nr:hypothetical protein [Phyllobacteriaceae bacterium]